MSYEDAFERAVETVLNRRQAAQRPDKDVLDQIDYTRRNLVMGSFQKIDSDSMSLFSSAKGAKIIDSDIFDRITKKLSNKMKDLFEIPAGLVLQDIRDNRARSTFGKEFRPVLKKYWASYLLDHSIEDFNQNIDTFRALMKQLMSEIERMMLENSEEVERIREEQWQRGEGARRQKITEDKWKQQLKRDRLNDQAASRSLRDLAFIPDDEDIVPKKIVTKEDPYSNMSIRDFYLYAP